MPSPFLALADAIADHLLADSSIAGDRVFRGRVRPLKKGMANGIFVRLVSSRAQLAGVGMGAPKDWETLIGVECCARAEPDEPAEDAVDAVLVAAYARLAGYAPAGLAVLDVFTEPAIDWALDDGEDQVCRASFVVQITHRTQAAALAAWA
jgi:hypothetical protein